MLHICQLNVAWQGETLFRTVIEVTGGGGGGGGGGGNTEAAVRIALDDYMARLPELLNIIEVRSQLRCVACLLARQAGKKRFS